METVEIPLTQGKVAIVDAADWPLVAGRKWIALKSTRTYYAQSTVTGSRPRKVLLMHRVILGLTDPEIEGDHKDGDGLNNRRNNLRPSTRLQNRQNRRKPKNSKVSRFKGIHRYPRSPINPWRAVIAKRYIGSFATEEEAAQAYDAAAKEQYGEFAKLNFPE